MFDVSWTELLVVGVIALLVVGPRELPQLLRKIGQTVGRIKRMAREFQRSMEDAAREADLGDLKELRDLKKELGNLDFRQQASRAQSYLKQPVSSGKGTGDGKGAAVASSAEASATEVKTTDPGRSEVSDSSASTASPSPASASGASRSADPQPAASGSGPSDETTLPRQAGMKG